MTPNINLIPAADLHRLQYLLWQPLEETWSAPVTLAAAMEAYARDPELQAAIVNQDGATGQPQPFAEIAKRARTATTPRSIEESAAMRQRANRVHAQRTAARQPDTTTTRASKLIIIYILGTLYITGGAAILYGLCGRFRTATEAAAYIIAGVAVTAAAIAAQRYTKKK